MAGGISIHGVGIARGIAAEGLRVELYALEPERRLIAEGRLAADGQLHHPVVKGEGVTRGAWECLFHLGDWYAERGDAQGVPRFLDVVPFRFVVDRVEEHFHLPLKFTPWGVQLFRGV